MIGVSTDLIHKCKIYEDVVVLVENMKRDGSADITWKD